MQRVSLLKVSGVCAVLTGIVVAAGFITLIVGANDLLDAENAAEALPILEEEKEVAATVLWLFVLGPVLAIAAALGFFQALRGAGDLIWIAAVVFVVGAFLVVARSVIELAVVYELAPAYVEADASTKSALEVVGDTLESARVIAGAVSDALNFGIGVLLFSLAILGTAVVPKWVGWLGIVVAVLAGWLSLLGPAISVFEVIGLVGFIGFWVWMIAMGVSLWRIPEPAAPES